MYMGVVWCGTRKSGKTPPFTRIFKPICMQMCPLQIKREAKASKHKHSFSQRLGLRTGKNVGVT